MRSRAGGGGGERSLANAPLFRSKYRDFSFLDQSRVAEDRVRSLHRNILVVTDMHKTTAKKAEPGTVTFRGNGAETCVQKECFHAVTRGKD
jgi:hypothetical protein